MLASTLMNPSEAPESPHKLNRGNKFNRYEDSKNRNNEDMEELQRNFSPINSQKTFGVRMGLSRD